MIKTLKQIDKTVNSLVDLIHGKEVNIAVHRTPQKILEHPTPTTYVWHIGHREYISEKRNYNHNRGMQKPKQFEPAYAGARK